MAHYLFKTAISELTSSKLKKGLQDPGVEIRFKNMRTEKEFVHGGKSYFIDVFGEFESPSRLQLKWGGLLGIEVCHSNPVEEEKKAAFRALELPVVQIKISDKLLYRTPEHLSTPDNEMRYVDFLKTKLTDFMGVNILCNPSTKEYLKEENISLKSKLAALEKQLESEKQRCDDLDRKNKALSKELEDKESQINQLSEQTRKANKDLEWIKSLNFIRFFFKKRFGW